LTRTRIAPRLLAMAAGLDGVRVGGLGLSGDVFVADTQQREALRGRFPGALLVDMESAAVARVAWENGVPFMALRGISDLADGPDAAALQAGVRLAAQTSADAAAALIFRLR
jgi:adenosylhomocysteine nucleosidase